jgi:hypothetical protein
MNEPWDRLPNERSKAYHLFCMYRDLGPTRTLERLARVEDSNSKRVATRANLKVYSRKYDWVARARSYDDYLAEKERIDNEQLILEMNRRQAEDGRFFQHIAVKSLNKRESDKLSPTEADRLFNTGVKTERLARGAQTEAVNVEVSTNVKVAQKIVADPEMRKLWAETLRRFADRANESGRSGTCNDQG